MLLNKEKIFKATTASVVGYEIVHRSVTCKTIISIYALSITGAMHFSIIHANYNTLFMRLQTYCSSFLKSL